MNIIIPSAGKQQQKLPFQGPEELYGEPIQEKINISNREQWIVTYKNKLTDLYI